MKNKPLSVAAVIAVTVGLALAGCGGAEQQQQQQTETPAAEAQTQTKAMPQAEAYPIDYCVVSGEKLGSMGDPVTYDYNGRTVKFCCQNCVKTFESSPAMYIAKLDSAAAGMMTGGHGGDGHEGHDH